MNKNGILESERKIDHGFVLGEVAGIMKEVVDEKFGITEEQRWELLAIKKEGNGGGMKDDRIFVRNKLARALLATYDLVDCQIEAGCPKNFEDTSKSEGLIIAERGVKANIEFGNFFLSINQRFGLSDEETCKLFDEIFGNRNFFKDLTGVRLEGFPRGVLAVAKTFLHLKNSLVGGSFRMANIEEDLHCGTDLVYESADKSEIFFYDIKSGGRKVEKIEVYNVLDDEELKMIDSKFHGKVADSHLLGLKKIIDFLVIKRKLNDGVKYNAYAVMVPT